MSANDPGAAATILVFRDPLHPRDVETHFCTAGRRLIDWLGKHYPAGFGRPVTLQLNGATLDIADADVVLQQGDQVAILVQPTGHVIGAAIISAIVSAALTAVVTVAFDLIFKPKAPAQQVGLPAADPIYSVVGAQNAARVGDPVPVLYGTISTVPDFASQPYSFFSNNDQFLDQLLVIGHGDHDLADVILGETPVSALESNAVQYWKFGPADHAQVMGRIEAATGVMENVVSSAEVNNQEFTNGPPAGAILGGIGGTGIRFYAPNRIQVDGWTGAGAPASGLWLQATGSSKNDRTYSVNSIVHNSGTVTSIIVNEQTVTTEDTSAIGIDLKWYDATSVPNSAGPFITSKPGAYGNRIMCDFLFPQGLYDANQSNGAIQPMTAFLEIRFQLVDDAGNPTGGYGVHPFSIQRSSTTPVRVTETVDVAPGRYRVMVVQTSPPPPSNRNQANFVWVGMKFRLLNATAPVYGPITLLAIRIRATNGIASQASSRIRAHVTRRLPYHGSGATRATTSPADAFVDVFCNPVYGAKRPLGEVDLAELTRIESSWAGQAAFNGAFVQKSTVWEALNIVLQTANAAPLPLGQLMSLAQEGTKATRRQLFSDANTVRGSLAIGYTFDKPGDYDGIQVEYRDPLTWNALYATYPPNALDVDQVQLFGCSDAGQAAQFARLLWQKRLMLRKTAHFETEMEGLLARLGDRIAVSADLPRWGSSGVLVGASGPTLWLDKAPDWTGSNHKLILRDQYGAPSGLLGVTPGPAGSSPFIVQLQQMPGFPLFGTGDQEPTHYAFGDSVRLVRDFTVQNVEQRDGARVAVEALAYDPAVFAGTLPWLATAT